MFPSCNSLQLTIQLNVNCSSSQRHNRHYLRLFGVVINRHVKCIGNLFSLFQLSTAPANLQQSVEKISWKSDLNWNSLCLECVLKLTLVHSALDQPCNRNVFSLVRLNYIIIQTVQNLSISLVSPRCLMPSWNSKSEYWEQSELCN